MEKLLALAVRLDTHTGPYNHDMWDLCAAGIYANELTTTVRYPVVPGLAALYGEKSSRVWEVFGNMFQRYHMLAEEFGITVDEAKAIFSSEWKGHDGTAAGVAAYIRQFVAQKAGEALPLAA